MKRFTPPLRNYRDYATERPPYRDLADETRIARLKRVLRDMPSSMFNNPELRVKALKRASEIKNLSSEQNQERNKS